MVEFIKFIKEMIDKDIEKKWKVIVLVLLLGVFISSNINELYDHLSSIPILGYLLHPEIIKYFAGVVFLLWMWYLRGLLQSLKALYRTSRLKLDKTNVNKEFKAYDSERENLFDLMLNSYLLFLIEIIFYIILNDTFRDYSFFELVKIPSWAFILCTIIFAIPFMYLIKKITSNFLAVFDTDKKLDADDSGENE